MSIFVLENGLDMLIGVTIPKFTDDSL